MDDPDSYLEKLFADSFRREVDQDESIWRTMPFFATALGLGGTVLAYVAHRLPPWSPHPVQIATYSLFGGACVSLVAAFAGVWMATRVRQYRYPPPDSALLTHVRSLKAFHEARGLSSADAAQLAGDDLRTLMIEEFAAASSNNRANNVRKQRARTSALSYLMIGLAFAFVAVALMFANGILFDQPAVTQELANHASTDRSGLATRRRDVRTSATTEASRPGIRDGGVQASMDTRPGTADPVRPR